MEEKEESEALEIVEVEPITQEWSISQIAEKRPSVTWEKEFSECAKTFLHIDKTLEGRPFFPLKKHLFRALDLCPKDKVKLLILGQDCYPQLLRNGKPKAVGLSFSIDYFDKDIPSSLKNIFAEIKRDYPGAVFHHGSLVSWAKQGVLLLNSALTFIEGDKVHTKLWEHFIVTILKEISSRPMVALLLGSHAQSYEKYLKNKCKKVMASHPSGRSAHISFNNSGCFKKCNELLEEMGLEPIDFSLH